jgi:hypothetical protein
MDGPLSVGDFPGATHALMPVLYRRGRREGLFLFFMACAPGELTRLVFTPRPGHDFSSAQILDVVSRMDRVVRALLDGDGSGDDPFLFPLRHFQAWPLIQEAHGDAAQTH